MSPRKVRRIYVRHLIVWGSLLISLTVAGFIWPWFGWGLVIVLGAVLAMLTVMIGIPCLVLAIGYFLKSGYWINPMRLGPWGDWKGEF